MTPVSTQNQTPSSVTSTTSSSSVFKYDQPNTTNAAISTSNNLKSDLTSNLECTTIDSNASASTGSSNVFSASMGPTTQVSSSSYSQFQSNTLNPSERINPFDKNKKPADPTTASSKPVETTASAPVTSYTSVSSSSSATGSTLDDLAKNRYDKYQGSQSQSTSGYETTTTSSDLYSSDTLKSTTSATSSYTSSYTTGSDSAKAERSSTSTVIPSGDVDSKRSESSSKPVTANQRTSAAKYAFGSAQYSTGSMSDSEIIFGSTDIQDPVSKRTQFGQNSANTVDASNSIYESSRSLESFIRSLSVSSDANAEFADDPRVNTSYRIYEGIQNAAFQDFDSPVKTATTSTENATNFSSTYVSGSKIFEDDDDDDLK